MTSDPGISFDDVEQPAPRRGLRPDENKHYAVVAYGEPAVGELPVYIDMDVLADMECHALSDTRVELGGVMLGNQMEDSTGRAFVTITDALRARHYKSTKGSFTFTHDTWSEITREREEFPEELEMVGWYHTHPGWGVFLSGMDTFICDNFFNRPLDVALVVDPCGQDRGVFQWTDDPANRLHRVGGFYVTASRFRIEELEMFVADLEESSEMKTEPRFRTQQTGNSPVIHLAQPQSWVAIACVTMLSLIIVVMSFMLIRMQTTPSAPPLVAGASNEEQIIQQRRVELLNEVLETLDRDSLADRLAHAEMENEVLVNQVSATSLGYGKLQQDAADLKEARDDARESRDQYKSDLSESKDAVKELKEERLELKKQLAVEAPPIPRFQTWPFIAAMIAAATIISAGVTNFVLHGKDPDETSMPTETPNIPEPTENE